jgi:ferric-dicitrate binding protein FerR (iron transport regulator)
MRQNVALTVAVATALFAAPSFAANLAIGVANAVSALSVNNAPAMGNVDVFDGTQLRTTIAPGDVHLDNGVDVRLAARSAGTVFRDHIVLHEGAVRVINFQSYPVHVDGLAIQAETPGTAAVVRSTESKIEVASIGGPVRVTDGGVMLTRVLPGTRMSFQNQTSGANPAQTGAPPGRTGAAPAPAEKGPTSDKKAFLWAAGVCGVSAIVIGSIAAAQGKSPF